MVDQTTIQAVKERNQLAFKAMYQGCIGYVYTIVRRYVSNESDYQDVIQEIFARVFLSIDSFDSTKGEFKFWLRRITINQCIKHFNQKKTALNMVPIDQEINQVAETVDYLEGFTESEVLAQIHHMPEGYKQVFMMVAIDGYSHQEVAKMLEISPVSSRSQLSRAKKWLQDNLSRNQLNLLAGGI